MMINAKPQSLKAMVLIIGGLRRKRRALIVALASSSMFAVACRT